MAGQHQLLVVDDEAANRTLLAAMARSIGYEAETAGDGPDALEKLGRDVDLVLLDVLMPEMDGFEVLRRIRKDLNRRDLPVIMVTGLDSKQERLRAAREGANDFISKPVELAEFSVRVASLLRMKDAQDAVKQQKAQLEVMVGERTVDLRRALKAAAESEREARKAHLDTVQRLAVAAEFKDEGTAAHVRRMSRYCELLARALGLPSAEAAVLPHASTMHDVGKIGVPDAILLKPGKLNRDEWDTMKRHTVIGARILRGSSSPVLQAGEVIAISHHERWDGSGYPEGLVGEHIPLLGRICAVADVFDALTSDRPYRCRLDPEGAVSLMEKGHGTHFDPHVLDVFLSMLPEVLAVRRE